MQIGELLKKEKTKQANSRKKVDKSSGFHDKLTVSPC